MQSAGTAFFDHIADLCDEASVYLDAARNVAENHFKPDVIDEIPLLTVQVAQLMATIDRNRVARKETA